MISDDDQPPEDLNVAAAVDDDGGAKTPDRRRLCAPPFLWIVLLAIALRAAAVIAVVGWEQPPSDKTSRYDAIALNLLEGEGFSRQGGRPTAVAPPLYPLLLAGVYRVAGYSETALRATLGVLDVVTCVVWMLIAWEILDRRAAWMTGLLYAICPYFIYMTVTAGSDTLFLLMLSVFMLILVSTLETPTRMGFVVAGVVLGLATLTRAVPLLFPIYLLPFLMLRYRAALGKALGVWILITCGFVATLTPWTIRNFVHFHRLVPVQTLGGYHLYLATTAYEDPESRANRSPVEGRGDVETDAGLYTKTVRRVAEHPVRFLRGMADRLVQMWYLRHGGRPDVVLGAANIGLLALASAGAYRSRRRWRQLLPILALISYFVLLHSVLFAMFRYMLPVVPALLMLASVPPVALLARMFPRIEDSPWAR